MSYETTKDPMAWQVERTIPQPGQIWVNTKIGDEYEIMGGVVNANNDAPSSQKIEVLYRKKDTKLPWYHHRRSMDEFMGTRDHNGTYVFRFVRIK